MTELTIPDTIPENIMEIGVSELTLEGVSSEMPCEIAGKFWNKCKSEGKEPATWMISHQNAEPRCTFLVCEPCVAHMQQWVAECVVRAGARSFGCGICGAGPFHYSEFITRQL